MEVDKPKEMTLAVDLQVLVERAVHEYYKSLEKDQASSIAEMAKHVANTVNGELHELEIIRKIAPIIRMIPGLQSDFKLIDDRLAEVARIQNLRLPDSEGAQ